MINVSVLTILLLQFLHMLVEVSGQSDCSQYFAYVTEPSRNEIWGQVLIPSPPKNVELHLRVSLSIAVRLSNTSYIGQIGLTQSKGDSVRAIKQGRPLLYHIRFPVQQPIPVITGIWFNNQLYCTGSHVVGPIITSFALEHSLHLLSQMGPDFTTSTAQQIADPMKNFRVRYSADLDIEISGNLNQDDSWYRLDYSPPVGSPPPNTTIAATEIGNVIKFRDSLPGTKYEYWLYYSNSTLHDWLTWTASIITPPDPPSNLMISIQNGKTAIVYWSPPAQGNYSGFRLRTQSFSDTGNPKTSAIPVNSVPYTLQDLTPGATYSLQLFTVLDTKESVAYISRNFTTKPNTVDKFIVWFRNETTLLILWQPPYPAGIYTHYKVSIDPPDPIESVLYVEKKGEPRGPAQAALRELVPGRAYNISVQTVSEDVTSSPTTAQYRTVPLRPSNVTFDKSFVTSTSFRVFWNPPNGTSEFDKYQVSLGNMTPVTRNRDDESRWEFKDLKPGKMYQVVVRTVSGNITSWPASADVTLKPLPVRDLRAVVEKGTTNVEVFWSPDYASMQDSFKLQYHEMETTIGGDSNIVSTVETKVTLKTLLPGRNYSITVQAISNKVESNETVLYQAT